MRLSVNSDDPGYKVYRALSRRDTVVLVTVNGLPVRHCITADTKRGVAVAADLDEQGKMQLNSKRDAIKCRTLTGKVSIAFERKASK